MAGLKRASEGREKWMTLSIVQICLLTFALGASQSCLPPTPTPSAGVVPDLPDLSESFRVNIEITVVDGNYTEQVEEIFDNAGNRAMLRLFRNGVEMKIIYSYDTSEVFYVQDNNCTVKNMSNDRMILIMGESVSDGLVHTPPGASALFFGDDIQKIYIGKATIRGILCDHWRACLASSSVGTNITIDYYFSEASWRSASTYPHVPIRYDVQGTRLQGTSSPSPTFHRLYDFFGYMAEADSDPSVFETPEGIACPGRQNTQNMPSLQSQSYRYRQEIVSPYDGSITHADVWYDLQSKLVRLDYRPAIPTPPLGNMNPLSEIHDYNFGVRYVKDLVTGQCTPLPLEQVSFDAKLNTAAYQTNGSYVLHMKDPISFFFLDSNFTFSGQRRTRDLVCDVYISVRNNFDLFNNGSSYQAQVEAYILANGWNDAPNNAIQPFLTQYPVRVELWLPKFNLNMVYNIFDFNTEHPEMPIFDVSDCYDDSAKLDFRVQFPGPYRSDTEHVLELMGQDALAQVMTVSPLRVTRVHVEHDATYVYLVATLLDRSPALAQFTHLPQAVPEHNEDVQWSYVADPATCADLCVNNPDPDFTCNSFQYCQGDRQSCGLSHQHIDDNGLSPVSVTCDLYSRSVDPSVTLEPTLNGAYENLLQSLRSLGLVINVPQDDRSEIVYVGVTSEILFGQTGQAMLPQIAGQFSYRVEVVVPAANIVESYDVWYDSDAKLARYDFRDVTAGPPFYSPFTISVIHDYNTGIAYQIDTHKGNCSISPITASIDAYGNIQNTSRGVLMVGMKSPLQIFYLDSTYTYTGQKTVRGILCDVFESKRSDFTVRPGVTENSIFQYFFQASSWRYVADSHQDITLQQPVMLTIMDMQANLYMIYNFYDFNDEHTSYYNYDISPCFSDRYRIDFVLDFNRSYYPYLAESEWEFKNEVQSLLASEARVSPLRIQNLDISYSLDQTYVVVSLLGEVAPRFHFAEDSTVSPYQATQIVPDSDLDGCAASCYYNEQMVCNSYDLCDDNTCLLSLLHVPDGNVTGKAGTCRHFSRLVNGTYPESMLDAAYTTIKDVVYKGIFVIYVPLANGSQVTYTAVGVRDDIFRQNLPRMTEGGELRRFSVFKTAAIISDGSLTLAGMAVDDCATACVNENEFLCEGFHYCYTTGDCHLNPNYPDQHPELISANPFCDVYIRHYTDEYTHYPGNMLEMDSASTSKAATVDLCAEQCSRSTAFNCLSFDFCHSTNDCMLRQVHVYDVPQSSMKNSTLCDHYSRSYLSDFNRNSQTVLPGHDDRVVFSVSVTTCATMCVRMAGCLSFEFCQDECHLSTASAKLDHTVTRSNTCDLYTLKATVIPPSSVPVTLTPGLPGGSSAATDKGCTIQQSNSGLSSSDIGARVGIAFGMLFLGTLLGAVLVVLVQRYRSKQNRPDMLELLGKEEAHPNCSSKEEAHQN